MRKGILEYKEVSQTSILKPNFHLNEGKRSLANLACKGIKFVTLGEIVQNVYTGGIFKRIFVSSENAGIPYISAQDMMNQNPKKSAKLISKKYTPRQNDMTLRENTILVSCAGTVGNIRLIDASFKDIIGSQDIIRVIPDISNYGFIYAYLSSKVCYSYIQSLIYGSVVPRIEPNAVSNIPVPIFPESKQQEIHNLIVESANLRVEANRLLEEATDFFDQLMKYENNISSKTISIRNIRNRFDSYSVLENNIIDSIIDENPTIEWIPIKTISEKIFIGPRSKRNYVAKGVPFLSGSELQKSNPTKVEKFLSIKDATPFIVNKDWVLITRSGTIGNVTYVFPVLDGYGATDDAIRVVVKASSKLSSKYLYAFLVSKFGHKCIQKDIFGSVIQHINEEQLGNILIPVLDINKVEEKIERYCSFMNDAIIKENQAIQLVEKEIESWQ